MPLPRRILLINPSLSADTVYGRYAFGAPLWPPLGLCYIAAALLDQGHTVQVMDCVAERLSLTDIRNRVQEFAPQVLGVTATTASFSCAQEVLALVKKIDVRIFTLLGGSHISARPRETLVECPAVDIGVCGEGELTVQELVGALEERMVWHRILGICYRQNGVIHVTAPRPNVRDIDQIPKPARQLLHALSAYSPNPLRGSGRAISLISSRGCASACAHCDQSVFKRQWRGHSVDYMLDEIKSLKANLGFNFFSFEDDNFLVDKERVETLCRRIMHDQLDIAWTCSARTDLLTPEILGLMRNAGCKIIYVGVETGSVRLLKLLGKGITLEKLRRGIELCVRAGLKVYGSFMIGLPTQTPAEVEETITFALTLPLDALSCFIYVPYPATPLRARALEQGFVSRDWRDYRTHPTRLPFVPAGMSEGYLLAKQREFYRRFYLRPSHLISHLPSYLSREFFARMLGALKNFLNE